MTDLATTQCCVLLVEDNPGDARLIREMLFNAGQALFHLAWVEHVGRALCHLAKAKTDVVLLDLSLSDSQGLEALHRVHAHAPDLPIVVLTGFDNEIVGLSAVRVGAQDYLVKGHLNGDLLEHALRYAIERKRIDEALQTSEQRFRLLAENARDIIYRYRLRPIPGFDYVSPAATAITGYSPEEYYADSDLLFQQVHPEDRPWLEAAMRPPFNLDQQDILLRWRRKDGAVIWVETRFTPIFDAWGGLVAIEGIGRDVTARKTAEQHLLTQSMTARVLAESKDLTDALPKILAAIGTSLNWDWCAFWGFDPHANVLRNAETWWRSSCPPIDFAELSHQLVLTPGAGMLRQVWASGRPIWSADLRGEPHYLRRAAAAQGGLRSTICFPIKYGQEFLGVVELVSRDVRPVDDALLTLIDGISHQIGQFVQRTRAEAERECLLYQLDDERRWLRAVIDCSPVGILLLRGKGGEHIVANQRAADLFGEPVDQNGGLGQYESRVLCPDGTPTPPEDTPSLRALRGEVVVGEEKLLRQPNGGKISVLMSAAPIHDENGITRGAAVILEEITALKELERLREEWTSIIAHDLRQPVAIIMAYASTLAKPRDAWAHLGTKPAEHILTSARQLNRMIADLLDASRIEAKRLALDPQPIDLLVWVPAVVERAAEITEGHQVRLRISEDVPSLWADPGRLEQVLANLLSNAAKYGYPQTEIDVEVRLCGGEIHVSVTNQGPGISPQELPLLFTRFRRSRALDATRISGLGLGLYICKGLVEAHRGRFFAESVVGQTTTFAFTVPIASELTEGA